jgi:hypothetical protein
LAARVGRTAVLFRGPCAADDRRDRSRSRQRFYINGTWTQKASLPAGYSPLYFASAVLPDGRVIINGGEYNYGAEVWTNQGAIFNPVLDTWTSVTPPPGWATIGDAPSTVLANGTYMLGNCCTAGQALFNAATKAWILIGAGKAAT